MSEKRRRSAEDARKMILDATEKRVREVGPDAVRLKDVAAALGISHTLILHHFGTRARLLEALVQRRVGLLRERLLRVLEKLDGDSSWSEPLLEQVFEAIEDPVHLRILAWLGLGPQHGVTVTSAGTLRRLAEALHERRVASARARGSEAPSLEDSLFLVMLTCAAVAGGALLEPMLFASSGLRDTPDAKRRYHEWLGALLARHVDDPPEKA